jgi:hypothetical protein
VSNVDAQIDDGCGMHKNSINLENTITGGNVIRFCQDVLTKGIEVDLESEVGGELMVKIPRSILDSRKVDCSDDRFRVLIHDFQTGSGNPWKNAEYSVKSTEQERNLIIQFGVESTSIVIMAQSDSSQVIAETCSTITSKVVTKECRKDLVSIIKPSGSSICVKADTAKILNARWYQKVTVEKIDTRCTDPWDNKTRTYQIFDELSLKDPTYNNLDPSDRFAMQTKIFKQFIEEQGIKVFDIKLRMDAEPQDTCTACDCNTGGHAWQFVISKKDMAKMIGMGFVQVG